MEQRLSLLTLGVADLERAVAFYGALGWEPANDWHAQDVAFFQTGGSVLALWDSGELARDSGLAGPPPAGAAVLAHNVRSPAEVDAVMEEARAAGATIARPAGATFWGGYSGLFHDPDGHPWEVAHNPRWTIAPDGSVRI